MAWTTWVKDVWDSGALNRSTRAGANYAYNTVSHLFKQLGVLPEVCYSLVTDKDSRAIASRMIYILGQDVLPLLAINATNNYVQREFMPEQDEEHSFETMDYLLISSLSLVHLVTRVYTMRQSAQMVTRTLLLSLKATDVANQMHPRPTSPICLDHKCSNLKHLKGGAREMVEYVVTDVGLRTLSRVPGMSVLSKVLTTIAEGRYIVKVTTPERCPYHRAIDPPYALALGLGHEGLKFGLNQLLERTVGLSSSICISVMEQMLLSFHIAIAAHLTPPLCQPAEEGGLSDPMELYERLVGWGTDVIGSGLKKQIPPLLKGPRSQIPWQTFLYYSRRLASHPGLKQAQRIMLPPMFQGAHHFVRDPVMSQVWPSVQTQLIDNLDYILKISQGPSTRVATWAPHTTALALKLIFGIPQSLTNLVITVVGNEKTRDFLIRLKFEIQDLSLVTRPLVVVERIPLAHLPKEPGPDELPSVLIKPNQKPVLSLTQLSKTSGKTETLSAGDLKKTSSRVLTPGDLRVRSHGPRFFPLAKPNAVSGHATQEASNLGGLGTDMN